LNKLHDRRQQLAPMPDGADPELFQVLRRQFRKNLDVDFIIPKRGLVSSEAEPSQPISDIHRRSRINPANA
jgi:hypothetical protein